MPMSFLVLSVRICSVAFVLAVSWCKKRKLKVDVAWIEQAMERSITKMAARGIRLVGFGVGRCALLPRTRAAECQ